MSTNCRLFLILVLIGSFLKGQSQTIPTLSIQKIKGSYHNTLLLPVKLRLVTKDDDLLIIKLVGIHNDYWIYNEGHDSIHISSIAFVNTTGIKPILKYSAFAATIVITAAATAFTLIAIDHTIATDTDNSRFKYVGMAYMGIFGSLATLTYLFPKTRFNTEKYRFSTK